MSWMDLERGLCLQSDVQTGYGLTGEDEINFKHREERRMHKNQMRSVRRHHRSRREKSVRKFIRNVWGWNESDPSFEHHVKRMRDVRTVCSCWRCGNPRKHFDLRTRQEQVSAGEFEEELRNIKSSSSSIVQ